MDKEDESKDDDEGISAYAANWTSVLQIVIFLTNPCRLVRYISPKHHTDLHINPFQLCYWLMRYITVSTEQVSVWDRWLRMDEAPHRCGQVWKRVHRNKRTAVWLITTLTRLLQQSFVYFPCRSLLRRSMDPGLNFLTTGRKKYINVLLLHPELQFNSHDW
jgi:hypothetical protein